MLGGDSVVCLPRLFVAKCMTLEEVFHGYLARMWVLHEMLVCSYASAAAHYGDYYGTEVQPPPPGTDVPLPYQQYYQPDATSYVPTTATYGHDAVTYGSTTTTYSRGPVTYGSEPVTYTSNPVTYDPAPPAVQFDLHQDDNVCRYAGITTVAGKWIKVALDFVTTFLD